METRPLTAMNRDLDAARGIVNGILLSLPFWLIVLLLLIVFGVIG